MSAQYSKYNNMTTEQAIAHDEAYLQNEIFEPFSAQAIDAEDAYQRIADFVQSSGALREYYQNVLGVRVDEESAPWNEEFPDPSAVVHTLQRAIDNTELRITATRIVSIYATGNAN